MGVCDEESPETLGCGQASMNEEVKHHLQDANAAKIKEILSDRYKRLNSLYYVIDKKGQRVLFQMNEHQQRLYKEMHYLNIVLKARQLGFTTFIDIFMLDACLFNSNMGCGVVADSLKRAQKIFADKIKYPYDNLPKWLLGLVGTKKDSTTELEFTNGSSIYVDTSMRGGTLQMLHISEYGKLCARFPEKANEVRTGALNTVEQGQIIFIESTAEGQGGDFYELTMAAIAKQEMKLSSMDFKFHFYPWWANKDYLLDDSSTYDSEMARYFFELSSEHDIELTEPQKRWYAKKYETQREYMAREYPSYPEEAFLSATDGAYYAKELNDLTRKGLITHVPYTPQRGCHVYLDIGMRDYCAGWVVQHFSTYHNVIKYFEGQALGAPSVLKLLKETGWWITHIHLPFDANQMQWGSEKTDSQLMMALCEGTGIEVVPVPTKHAKGDRILVQAGINAVRYILPQCRFDRDGTGVGIMHLRQYSKEWNDKLARFDDKPKHDKHSHGADAFRYMAVSVEEALEAARGDAMTEAQPIDRGNVLMHFRAGYEEDTHETEGYTLMD